MISVARQYVETVRRHITAMSKSCRPRVVFGAGRAGWYIMKVFEHYGLTVTCFADNNRDKQGFYCDYPVKAPDVVAREFPDAHVFIGVFLPATATAIQSQFNGLNLHDVHYEMAAFLYVFMVEVVGRRCDREILARSIHILSENYKDGPVHYGYTRNNYYVSPFVTSVITQRCSLKCRDCAQLIPYYENPVHFPVETVIRDLKQYAKAFDVVPEISLHGGEPFLHPDIAEICREVAAIPNVVFTSFISNGTICPSDAVLQQLSASAADVHQSGGYGALSRKQRELTEALRKYSIYSDILFCSPEEMWTQPAPFVKRDRAALVNDRIYSRCVSTKVCCQIMDGELHRCALSMHGMHQRKVPMFEDDFVRLDQNLDDAALVRNIRGFLSRRRALNVCDYCDPDGGSLVEPAIQLQPVEL